MYHDIYIIQYYTDNWYNCCNNAGELIKYNKLDDAKFVANKVYIELNSMKRTDVRIVASCGTEYLL